MTRVEPILAAERPANADWVRALQRTADISPHGSLLLVDLVDARAASHGDSAAFENEDGRLTYGELAALANRCARWALAEGFATGDRVALMMANRPIYAAIWLGLSRIGVVTALINTNLVGSGLAHCLRATRCKAAIADLDGATAIAAATADNPLPSVWICGDTDGDRATFDHALAAQTAEPLTMREGRHPTLADPALLIFTSGTTGLPKAAHVSHYRVMMWSQWFAGIMDATAEDRLYTCLPMYHSVGGVVAVGAMLACGGSVIVRRRFSASRFWPDVAASGATILQYIGELCRFLLAAPPTEADTRHRLRLACGNGLREDVWRAFVPRFAIPRVIEFYAATEGSFSLFNLEGRPGAIGRVPRFMAHRSPVAIVRLDSDAERPLRTDDGFCIRCATDEPGEAIGQIAANPADLATRFEGYTDAVETERKVLRNVFAVGDAWFRTGDVMKKDAQGFFFFVDRIGDTFRWKGENVATAEVADVVSAAPGVREATVYGVTVPGADGRAGMAAIVPDDTFTLAALHAHVTANLPRYARPLMLRLIGELAITGTFKPRKADLQRDGFDPALVADPLFVENDGGYRNLDAAAHAAILSGDCRL